ncbi:4-alpha-glucanotransferase [Streptomyces sp. NPDC002490]|uniref:4-alpha-glucanotransferase n=1 Tax=Streptomyces sp. NPDC002490 TaxID=3154416 RepID=UPI00332FC768
MPLARLAALHGVATSYSPAPGRTVEASPRAVRAALAALGVDAGDAERTAAALAAREAELRTRLLPPTLVWWPNRPPRDLLDLPTGTRVRIAPDPDGHPVPVAPVGDGGWTAGPGVVPVLPEGFPHGVHALTAAAPDGRAVRTHLVVAPERAPAPAGRSHGLLVQLHSLLSRRSWGMGDLGDLADLADWAGTELGAGFVQLNPLHAAVPGEPGDPSPYRPSSRRFPDPVHLRIEDVPEHARLPAAARAEFDALTARAAELRQGVLDGTALIDRDAVRALKRQALDLLAAVPPDPGRRAAYREFTAREGAALDDYATWCALAERHGPDWRTWPGGLTDPRSPETDRARAELAARIDHHRWLVWLTAGQLDAAGRAARAAGMPIGLVHDLAVGVHPHGADTWAGQDLYAADASIGAPPDDFAPQGQDWGLPPWRPDRLAATGYAPYRALLRALFRHAGALRIDHVMGLFRLWWVPAGGSAAEGAYVHYDAEAMLAVLVLEADRAGAAVIGEDLGTVADGVREALRARGVLGTSVLWFERGGTGEPLPPDAWRPDCLATATTHDLPPTAARLAGTDVDLRDSLGLLGGPPDEARAEAARATGAWLDLFARCGLLAPGSAEDEVERIGAVHRFLVRTPARLVGVWLPDAVGDRRPQNVPGTRDEYPNWRLPVAGADGRPLALEDLVAAPRVRALVEALRWPVAPDG